MNNKHTHPDLDWDIVSKVISGEGSEDDKRIIQSWIDHSDANKREWEQISSNLIETDRALIAEKVDIGSAYQNVKNAIDEKKNKKRSLVYLYSIAASISLLIGFFFLFNQGSPVQITSNATNFETHTLPDGSVVDLNKNSSITIEAQFNNKARHIALVGEAFFKVKPNTNKPFIVNIGDINVKVLGTSFNIKENTSYTEIIVNSGLVEVYRNNNEKTYQLKKGDKLVYNTHTNGFTKNINSDVNYLSWKTKELRFKNDPLISAIALIEGIYNVELKYPDTLDVASLNISATFNKNDIDFITSVLSKTYDTEFSYLKQ